MSRATRVKPKTRIVPRDEIIFRGEMAGSMSTQRPKKYFITIKSSTRRATKVVIEAHNWEEVYSKALKEHARAHEDLYVYNAHRSLFKESRSKDY